MSGAAEAVFIDGLYFCFHHTDKGFPGERFEYKCDCGCRKPKAGRFLMAAHDFNIDLSQSYMIGDSPKDVEAGGNAGCKQNFLIKENESIFNALNKIL